MRQLGAGVGSSCGAAVLVARVKTGRNLCGNRVSPWCPGASIVVCSLYSRVALVSLTVAGIITPVEVLTAGLWYSVWDWEQGLKRVCGVVGGEKGWMMLCRCY